MTSSSRDPYPSLADAMFFQFFFSLNYWENAVLNVDSDGNRTRSRAQRSSAHASDGLDELGNLSMRDRLFETP